MADCATGRRRADFLKFAVWHERLGLLGHSASALAVHVQLWREEGTNLGALGDGADDYLYGGAKGAHFGARLCHALAIRSLLQPDFDCEGAINRICEADA